MGISYKSFCWSLGTTSFRTKDFNRTIEIQLALLNEFWSFEKKEESWSKNNDLQSRYYKFMQKRGFVVGDATRKDKDAREKTSGLVDIGLVNRERKLSPVGEALLQISASGDFAADNPFQIAKDSFIYLKQLLKTSYKVNDQHVRPFIVFLYLVCNFGYLSLDEFTYLMPLCVAAEETREIVEEISKLRLNHTSVDDIIINRLMSMSNYQVALRYFLESDVVTKEVITEVGFNRKSHKYDKKYYDLYLKMYEVFVNGREDELCSVYDATKKIGKWWRNYLFDSSSEKAIRESPKEHLRHTDFDSAVSETDFKTVFFKTMHLFKAKATLSDYFDLNRRYIKTTDIVLFEDDRVKLDIVPFHFFKSVMSRLRDDMFTESDLLYQNCDLKDISSCLVVNDAVMIESINEGLKTRVTTLEEARQILENNRYRRLQHLIDTKFTDRNIELLLDYFEKRNDKEIRKMVSDNADVPTIFEYVVGILWYKISERKGKILDYMKLSLDGDLLPKTHASGGEADIVYEYAKTKDYPEHSLLLEVTLAEATNQRRMEMEPVSRHLGTHLLKTGNKNSYCVFATNYLDINVLADFRLRKTGRFYDPGNPSRYIEGMKIIPLQTTELKKIVQDGKTYKELYIIFDKAFQSDLPPHEWYAKCIVV